MITHKLNFNPHVVWADLHGFHAFGLHPKNFYNTPESRWTYYHQGEYFQLTDISEEEEEDESSYHSDDMKYYLCNHVYQDNDKVHLVQYCRAYIILDPLCKTIQLVYNYHKPLKKIFDFYRCKSSPYVINYANFHCVGNTRVFTYNECLWINELCFKHKTRRYQDAKISPDESTIALAIGGDIQFMDVSTKIIKHTLNTKHKRVQHLCYSLDGLTIAAVTSGKNLMIWDVE